MEAAQIATPLPSSGRGPGMVTDVEGGFWHGFAHWDGWQAVSGVAQLLSLLTLAFALVQLSRNRRQFPLAGIGIDVIGSVSVGEEQARYHVVEFRNAGRGIMNLIALEVFQGRLLLLDGYHARSHLGSGDSFRLLLTSPNVEDVWIRAAYRVEDHRHRVVVRWLPLARQGAIAEQWFSDRDGESRLRMAPRRLMDRFRPRPVMPGHAVDVAFNARRNGRARAFAALNPDEVETEMHSSAFPSGIADLPYVAP